MKRQRQEVEDVRTELEEARESLAQQDGVGRELHEELGRVRQAQQALEEERTSLKEALAQRQSEVDDLRSVMETYVEQIKTAQELHAQQAANEREIQASREQLETARREQECAREDSIDSGMATEMESMRQAMHDLQQTLEER